MTVFSKSFFYTSLFQNLCFSTFVINDEASRIGVFRYNRLVDTRSQILLRDYPNSRAGLLRAYDRIPYNGRGRFVIDAYES